jgi:SAM-dependent methyltransferase
VATAERLPFPDARFDLVFSDNVLEHLDEPVPVFREVFRVLRPGGLFLAKTPNRHHYVALLARLTPTSFHRWINRRRGRQSADTFPTRYRANSRGRIRELAAQVGFEIRAIELVEGRPEYLRLTAPTYALGCAYERIVNAVPALEPLRVLLIASLRKPGPSGTGIG